MALARNVAASSARPHPGPRVTTITPASAGPRTDATFLLKPSSAFACCRFDGSAVCGTSAIAAGPKNASAVPYTPCTTASCHTWAFPLSNSTALTPCATARANLRPASPTGAAAGQPTLRQPTRTPLAESSGLPSRSRDHSPSRSDQARQTPARPAPPGRQAPKSPAPETAAETRSDPGRRDAPSKTTTDRPQRPLAPAGRWRREPCVLLGYLTDTAAALTRSQIHQGVTAAGSSPLPLVSWTAEAAQLADEQLKAVVPPAPRSADLDPGDADRLKFTRAFDAADVDRV